MPSPIYQYVANLVVSLLTRRGPDVFTNDSVREHVSNSIQITIIIIISHTVQFLSKDLKINISQTIIVVFFCMGVKIDLQN